jgi:hypothetical protein
MESKAASEELDALVRLQSVTKQEARRLPAWWVPVFLVGFAVFFLTINRYPLPATTYWVAFVAVLTLLTRRRMRVRPIPVMSRREIAAFIAAGALATVVCGALIGSAAAGAAGGSVGAAAGALAAWRGSHQ